MADPPHPGSAVAGYRLVSPLGRGATGTVYLAERPETGERVALKLLDPAVAGDERFRGRFLRESSIAAGLEHPNVVPILDVGEEDGTLFLAMRHIDGADLRELLARDGPLAPDRALHLLAGIADALDVAHARGLIHRDVKPANILVERVGEDDEQAYLGDFGLAKHAASASSLSRDHAFVGTIAYVSPEQIRGDAVDGRADVYALGCVLYECLAGVSPFDRSSELAVVYAHLNERAPLLTDARPDLPAALDGVIRRATAKVPDERFASCGELIGAARAALAGARVRRRPGRAAVVLGAGLALAVAGALVIVLVSGGDPTRTRPPPALAAGGAGLTLVDGSARRVAARVALPEAPGDVAFRDGTAWATLRGAERLAEVDVRRRRVTGTVGLPFAPGGVAAAGPSVFVTEDAGTGVVRVAARTRRITARWDVAAAGGEVADPTGIAAGAGSVWLARGSEVVRVDARTGRERRRYSLPVRATLLKFADGALWAASSQNGVVEKIDPATDRIASRITLHGWISALEVAGGSVWAAVTPDGLVYRLSADDASVQQTLRAGDGPESLTADRGGLWVANSRGHALTRLDMRTGERTAAVPLTGSPYLVRATAGLLWTAAERAAPRLAPAQSGPEIRVAVRDDGLELDPAFGPFPQASQLLYATCAKLMNYPDAAGEAGKRLVPEVAAAMPAISADGRTYTFRIRPGIRFSPPSNEEITARTMKATIERTLSPKIGPVSSGLFAAGDIVGARAFHAGRASGVRGIVADRDRLTIRLTRPNGDLLSRLAMPLFCAVPSRTPAPGKVRGPIPMAGPYYVRSSTASETILDRNPNYRGTRPRRPARITYVTGVPTARSVALAGAGRVDVVTWDFDQNGPLAPGGALDRRYRDDAAAAQRDGAPRYHLAPAPGLDLIAFNTRRPLFSDVRLRRAVNFALDRSALAAVFNESTANRYVPPGIPGTTPASTYPLRPDLAAARRAAGPLRRRKATIYFCGEPANRRIAEIVRANLRPLRISVSIVDSLGCLRGPDPKAGRTDMLLMTRSTPELDPGPFVDATLGASPAFGPANLPVTWDDRRYRERLDRARALTGSDRLTAYARILDDMERGPAPYAAYGAFVSSEYFSARTSCRVLHGAYGVVDLAALCVRGG